MEIIERLSFFNISNTDYIVSKFANCGWFQLIPLDRNSVQIEPFLFPRYYTETYSIGCSDDDDVLLPRTKERERELPKVMILVEDGEIWIENLNNADVRIDGKILNVNIYIGVVPKNVETDVVLKFGRYYYALHTPVSEFLYLLSQFTSCLICLSPLSEYCSLPCGHGVCQKCLNALTNAALDDDNPVIPIQLMAQNNPSHLPLEIAKVKCPQCLRETSINEIAEVPRHPVLTMIIKLLQSLTNERIVCPDCYNVRCVSNSYDYWKCESCSCNVCPLCAVEQHANHRLQMLYTVRLNSWLSYQKKSVAAKLEYRSLRKQCEMIASQVEKVETLLTYCRLIVELPINVAETIILKPAKELYSKLKKLARFCGRYGVDSERQRILQSFYDIIPQLHEIVTKVQNILNKRIFYIDKTEMIFCVQFEECYMPEEINL